MSLYRGTGWSLHVGSSEDVLPTIDADSIDALITDPPAGIGFMGKAWDSDKGGRNQWIAWLTGIMRECYRAMKPGAHGLVWALPRTSHWTATACEDAGFEIRDVVMHLFGTGFPKSLDVSKAIDKSTGAERPVIGSNPNHLAVSGTEYEGVYAGGNTGAAKVTAPATPEAAQWSGWHTALKPAAEHWILIRKPLESTVAANVLAHGTGAMNIDGCRIGSEGGGGNYLGGDACKCNTNLAFGATKHPVRDPNAGPVGRWPANVVLSHAPECMPDSDPGERVGADVDQHTGCAPGCAVAVLDEQSGAAKPRKATVQTHSATDNVSMSGGNQARLVPISADSGGGASRFFYVAKAPRTEKDAGLDHLPMRTGGEATDREEGSAGLSNPRAGAGRTGGARNDHPTVKSIALMRWLARLITPPGGTVLDPFAGSGTTMVAARMEGAQAIGIEQDPGHASKAERRVRHWAPDEEAA